MLLKKDSYIYKQLTFALISLRHMFDDETIASALKRSNIEHAKHFLARSVSEDKSYLLSFIFDDLLSTEDDTERIRDLYGMIDSISEERIVKSFRYRENDRSGSRSNDYTDGCIESIAASILSFDKPNDVMDIGCGQGVFLAEAKRQEICSEYYGIEINQALANIAKLKMLILGCDDSCVDNSDLFSKSFGLNEIKQYDRVFCHMPMAMELDKSQLVASGLLEEYDAARFSHRDSEWVFIKAMQRMTKPGGKCVAVVRNGLLFTEHGRQFRKELVEKGLLEAVILLPPNLLNNTAMPVALVVCSEGNETVKMIDASPFYEKGRRVNTISSEQKDYILDLYLEDGSFEGCIDEEEKEELASEFILVDAESIAKDEYVLDPTWYLLRRIVRLSCEKKLSEATTRIYRGVQIRADDMDSLVDLYAEEPNCYVLNLADISRGYIREDLERVHIDDLKPYKRYMLEEGDVILSARGTKISIAVAEDIQNRKIIVTGNLVVIQCNESLDPYYLKAFLESSDGMALLKSFQTGGRRLFAINPRQLREMSFENRDIHEQKEIGQKVKWMINELRESYKRVNLVREKLAHVYDDMKEV